MLQIRYDMNLEEFYAQGGTEIFINKVASMLSIPINQIRLLVVAPDSVIIEIQISFDYQESDEDAIIHFYNYTSTLDRAVIFRRHEFL